MWSIYQIYMFWLKLIVCVNVFFNIYLFIYFELVLIFADLSLLLIYMCGSSLLMYINIVPLK